MTLEPCTTMCPFHGCGPERCPAPGGDPQGTLITAGQTSYNTVVPKKGRDMIMGHATPEQSDPPGAFLAVGSTEGSDHQPTIEEST